MLAPMRRCAGSCVSWTVLHQGVEPALAKRDHLLDVVGNHFTGRQWPRAGDVDATGRFMADLQREMTMADWKVDQVALA
jgi:hypothetical protein